MESDVIRFALVLCRLMYTIVTEVSRTKAHRSANGSGRSTVAAFRTIRARCRRQVEACWSDMLPMSQFNPKMSSTRCIRSPVSKLPFTKSFPQLRIGVDRPGKKHHASRDPGQVPGVRSSRARQRLKASSASRLWHRSASGILLRRALLGPVA